jgi:hypothetical protein
MKTFTQNDPPSDAEFDRLGDFLKSCKGGSGMIVGQLDGFFAARTPPRSRLLRSMEHVKEHGHCEATERINERREKHRRRNQTAQDIKEGEDERPQQESRLQNSSDQCQQCRILECHDSEYERWQCWPQLWLLLENEFVPGFLTEPSQTVADEHEKSAGHRSGWLML